MRPPAAVRGDRPPGIVLDGLGVTFAALERAQELVEAERR
jgi:hypothetical protein